LVTITNIAVTSEYVYGMTPGQTTWWQVIDHDSFGSATSNQHQVNQPATAVLTYTMPTPTSAQFSWTNNANYGGLVAFSSYQLMESVNGGSWSTATTITVESTRTYTLKRPFPGDGLFVLSEDHGPMQCMRRKPLPLGVQLQYRHVRNADSPECRR